VVRQLAFSTRPGIDQLLMRDRDGIPPGLFVGCGQARVCQLLHNRFHIEVASVMYYAV
jgi:hypothetical protein